MASDGAGAFYTEPDESAPVCPTPREFAVPLMDEIIRGPCRRWGCPVCGPNRRTELALRIRHGIHAQVKLRGEDVKFLTLTLDPKRNEASAANGTKLQAEYVSACFRRLIAKIRERCRRKEILPPWYVKVADWRDKTDAMHLHILMMGWIPSREGMKADIVKAGFGHVYKIETVRSVRQACRYLTKYVAEAATMKAPRFVHRYSSCRGGLPPLSMWKRLISNGYAEDLWDAVEDEDAETAFEGTWWEGESRENLEAEMDEIEAIANRDGLAPTDMKFIGLARPQVPRDDGPRASWASAPRRAADDDPSSFPPSEERDRGQGAREQSRRVRRAERGGDRDCGSVPAAPAAGGPVPWRGKDADAHTHEALRVTPPQYGLRDQLERRRERRGAWP
jgi:hypothetical protein